MKRLNSFLIERKGEKAHKEAIAMGLQYKGFGYWADPTTGETKYKTENDSLVPVEEDPESDLYKGDEKESESQGQSFGGMMSQMKPGMMQMPGMPQQMSGAGENIKGAPEPGEEQAPVEMNWDAGPDGSTCFDPAQPKDELPSDTFVGKSNSQRWTAGPEGHNYTNKSYESLFEGMFDKLLGNNNSSGKSMTSSDFPSSAFNALFRSSDNDSDTPGSSGIEGDEYYGDNSDSKPEPLMRDRQKVESMNQSLRKEGMLSNPDLDMHDVGRSFGAGEFGTTFLHNDGKTIVKDGDIGSGEVRALHALRDVPGVPRLVNAEFRTPFNYDSSSVNNPDDDSPRRGSRYFRPDANFTGGEEKRFGLAKGRFAMEKAKGVPIDEVMIDMDDEDRDANLESIQQKFFAIKAAMNGKGIAHRDLHGGNIFIDPETNNVSLLDFGLAEDDPMSAFAEAFGLMGDDNSYDEFRFANLGENLKKRFSENKETVREMIMDRIDPDNDGIDPEDIEQLLGGKWRPSPNELDSVKNFFPFLQDNDNVLELIQKFYEGVGIPATERETPGGAKDALKSAAKRIFDVDD